MLSPLCSAQPRASLFPLCVAWLHRAYVPATLCLQSGLPWKEDLEFELCQILSGQICLLPGVTVLCTGAKCSSPAFIGNKAAGWSCNACCCWPPLCTPGWPGPCLKYIYSGDRQLGCQASLCYLPTWDSGKVIYFLVSLSAFVK